MDSFLLARLARELDDDWAGAWIQQVWQDVEGRLVLQLRRSRIRAETRYLLLSPLAEAQGLGILTVRPPCPPRPPALACYLRAHIVGGRVEFARCQSFERVVELGLRGREGVYRLVFEAIGRRGNLVVVDPEGLVRIAFRWEPAQSHPKRPLEPALPYALPPRPPGLLRPDDVTAAQWDGWLASAEPLHRRIEGVGPTLGRELAALDWGAFRAVVGSWGARTPVWECGQGLSVVPTSSLDGRYEDALEPAGRMLEASLAAARSRAVMANGETRLRTEKKRLTSRIERIRGDLDRLPDPAALRRTGDVLAAGLWAVKRGVSEARVADPSDPEGNTILIPLNAALSPGENLNQLYERARRAERARVVLERRIEETLAELAAADTRPAEIRSVAASGETPGLPYRRFRASNGWPLWVGRNGKENARLLKDARPWDLWLHARGASGAHVLVRLPGREAKVPEGVVLEAAALAARHSRAAGDAAVDVMVAEAGRVRKPKGAAPGRVVVSGERTVRVRPAP